MQKAFEFAENLACKIASDNKLTPIEVGYGCWDLMNLDCDGESIDKLVWMTVDSIQSVTNPNDWVVKYRYEDGMEIYEN